MQVAFSWLRFWVYHNNKETIDDEQNESMYHSCFVNEKGPCCGNLLLTFENFSRGSVFAHRMHMSVVAWAGIPEGNNRDLVAFSLWVLQGG